MVVEHHQLGATMLADTEHRSRDHLHGVASPAPGSCRHQQHSSLLRRVSQRLTGLNSSVEHPSSSALIAFCCLQAELKNKIASFHLDCAEYFVTRAGR
jgi:hypothetical protein